MTYETRLLSEVYSSMPLIPAIFIRLNIAAPFYPGSANVQPMKPGCAEQTRSSHACSIILDFFILVLCNTPLLSQNRPVAFYKTSYGVAYGSAIATAENANFEQAFALSAILNFVKNTKIPKDPRFLDLGAML